jgi:hypothetical protein
MTDEPSRLFAAAQGDADDIMVTVENDIENGSAAETTSSSGAEMDPSIVAIEQSTTIVDGATTELAAKSREAHNIIETQASKHSTETCLIPTNNNNVGHTANDKKMDLLLSDSLTQHNHHHHHHHHHNGAPLCEICLNEYEHGDLVAWSKNINCKHAFHVECITDWLLRRPTCPCCRQDYIVIPDNMKRNSSSSGGGGGSSNVFPLHRERVAEGLVPEGEEEEEEDENEDHGSSDSLDAAIEGDESSSNNSNGNHDTDDVDDDYGYDDDDDDDDDQSSQSSSRIQYYYHHDNDYTFYLRTILAEELADELATMERGRPDHDV